MRRKQVCYNYWREYRGKKRLTEFCQDGASSLHDEHMQNLSSFYAKKNNPTPNWILVCNHSSSGSTALWRTLLINLRFPWTLKIDKSSDLPPISTPVARYRVEKLNCFLRDRTAEQQEAREATHLHRRFMYKERWDVYQGGSQEAMGCMAWQQKMMRAPNLGKERSNL